MVEEKFSAYNFVCDWKVLFLALRFFFAASLLPLWFDFSESVWIQTICPKVVWIWSEFSPLSLNSKNNDQVYRLLKFGYKSYTNYRLVYGRLYIYSNATYT